MSLIKGIFYYQLQATIFNVNNLITRFTMSIRQTSTYVVDFIYFPGRSDEYGPSRSILIGKHNNAYVANDVVGLMENSVRAGQTSVIVHRLVIFISYLLWLRIRILFDIACS